MVDYGITDDGLVIKRQPVIQDEIEESLRAILGTSINLLPTETLGQIVGIISEREALVWELAQLVYDSQYPETASGVNLDYVVSLTGIERLGATFSRGVITCYGTLGTTIPAGSVISVAGNPDARFETDSADVIGPGTDEVQDIDFSATSAAGDWDLVFGGETTASLPFNASAAAVQTALNNLTSLSAVSVAGDMTAGFTVTFSGADGQKPQALLVVGSNTLEDGGATPVDITITETTPGELPNVDVSVTAETAGEVQALAGTLTVIESVVAGWDSCTNELDVTVGKEIETDAELRVRRIQTLSQPGAATINAIRAKILSIDEVKAAVVFENITLVTDSQGLPPKSIAPVVLDGDDNDIAEAIFAVAPAGIELFGSVTVQLADSQGILHDINFSRPTEIDIYLHIDIKTDPAEFPAGGEDAIVQAVLDFVQDPLTGFSIADDVITTLLYCPINDVAGIIDIDLRIGTSNPPLVQTLTWDADFVPGNNIDGQIAGTPITTVPYNATHNQTMTDLANEIASDSKIASAVVTGAREITVTSVAWADPGSMTDFVATGGVSQPNSAVASTSQGTDNIPIDLDEISSWDSSRIVVTNTD